MKNKETTYSFIKQTTEIGVTTLISAPQVDKTFEFIKK